MNFIFDIDGTISADPSRFRAMMKTLREGGHTIHVLTGALSEKVISTAERKQQLLHLGVFEGAHYDFLAIACGHDIMEVARGKGEYCKKVRADVVFEDSLDYIRLIKTISPGTLCLLVQW